MNQTQLSQVICKLWKYFSLVTKLLSGLRRRKVFLLKLDFHKAYSTNMLEILKTCNGVYGVSKEVNSMDNVLHINNIYVNINEWVINKII